MTANEFVDDICRLNPDLVLFDPYVIGLPNGTVKSSNEDPLLRAAASILLNDLQGAHEITQADEDDPVHAYLHGIIHRREGDFWNANYWFRRAKSLSAELKLEPEGLTARVQGSQSVSAELKEELLNELKTIITYII